jgi:hypothetical protein
MSCIQNREAIAARAEDAARTWVANPRQPRPANPFDEDLQPDHFHQFRASLERWLVALSAPECETSA